MTKDNVTRTIGVDLGDKRSAICVIEDSRVVSERRKTVATTRRGFRRFFSKQPPCRVVLETGTHSPWASEVLKELGHEVVVANARRVDVISRNCRKTDQADAELLARLGRADTRLLSPIEHRGPTARRDRTVLRVRDGLVRTRTGLVNSARGLVKSLGERLKSGISTKAFAKRVRASELPAELLDLLEPLLAAVEAVSEQIEACEQRIKEITKRYPEAAHLQCVPGVGPITSLAFVLAIEDPHRFTSSRRVGSYFGLVPRLDASGRRDPELRITKAGDAFVRRLLVQSAHYVLGPFGPDSALRQWGLKLAARGKKNAKKCAVIAVARKLGVLLHRLWITGEAYEPFRNAQRTNETSSLRPATPEITG